MIASWMAFAALVSAVLTIAGVALERVTQARGWPRRWVWLTVMVASVAWPAASALKHLLPAPPEPVLPFSITVLPAQAIVASSGVDRAVLIDRGLAALWTITSLVLLVRLARGMLRLRATRAEWRRGEIDGMAVRFSSNVGPAVVGLRSMEVVLPEWITSLDAPLRALVLRHEDEHRRERDPYLLLAAAVAVALMPWNAALWYQAWRLRLAIEMDCDARVLRAHPARERYGMLMLTIAQRRSIVPALFAPMLSEPTTNLERTILAMRDSTRRITRVGLSGAAVVAIGALAFACTLQSDNPTAPTAAASPQRVANEKSYFDFQVEKAAAPLPGNAAPRYPDLLRAAKIEGEVLAQFVVGPDSTVDMKTLKFLRSSHELFSASVRNALPAMRFSPAQVGGRPVKQLLQMPFMFSLSKDDATAGPATVPQPALNREPAGRAMLQGGVAPQPARVMDRDTYFEFQVEKPVSPRPDNPAVRYPDMLRAANIEGTVLAQFVVGTDGRPDMSTFKVLKSSHELFTEAVKNALPQMAFNPAEVKGKAVKQLVQMPFEFSLAKKQPSGGSR